MRKKFPIKNIGTKSDWILIFLSALDYQPIEGSVRLMKELFLFLQEAKKERLTLPRFYTFIPYLYGPCAFEVYKDIKKLKKDNLIKETLSRDKRWMTFQLTIKGKETAKIIFKGLPKDVRKMVEKIKSKYNGYPLLSLLKHVYEKYPEWAIKSIVMV